MAADHNWMSVADVAARLGVSKMTVYRLAGSGALRGYRIGRSVRINERDFNAYLRNAEIGAA